MREESVEVYSLSAEDLHDAERAGVPAPVIDRIHLWVQRFSGGFKHVMRIEQRVDELDRVYLYEKMLDEEDRALCDSLKPDHVALSVREMTPPRDELPFIAVLLLLRHYEQQNRGDGENG